jgi:hypothetical protein
MTAPAADRRAVKSVARAADSIAKWSKQNAHTSGKLKPLLITPPIITKWLF